MSPATAVEARNGILRMLRLARPQLIQDGVYPVQTSIINVEMDAAALLDLLTRELSRSDLEIIVWGENLWNAAVTGNENVVGQNLPVAAIPRLPQFWLSETYFVEILPGEPDAEAVSRFYRIPVPIFSCAHVVLPIPPDMEEGGTGKGWGGFHISILAGDAHFTKLYIRVMPPLFSEDPIAPQMAGIAAAQMFMTQRFIGKRKEEVAQKSRRRLERAGDTTIPTIKTVILRREAEAGAAKAAGEPAPETGVNWNYQWFVTGGWQKRRIGPRDKPEEQSHRPVYIDSYVKGPKDKPLKLPKATVLKVAR